MRKNLFLMLALFLLMLPFTSQAQEAAPAAQDVPAEAQEPVAEQAAPVANPNEPGDIIAAYFDKMSDIIANNMDSPDALLDKFAAYIKENEKSMKAASKAFDAKMASLKSSDAEVYRETVQRKITPSLNKLISLLIDFSSRHPVEAQKLDSLLKVDAKYTYQQ
ncbi:MAG: hypothetical protein IJU23_10280 [Proteobacteria bacterium]|nr:hypothetical protein [Pseudomonadota bacterium]